MQYLTEEVKVNGTPFTKDMVLSLGDLSVILAGILLLYYNESVRKVFTVVHDLTDNKIKKVKSVDWMLTCTTRKATSEELDAFQGTCRSFVPTKLPILDVGSRGSSYNLRPRDDKPSGYPNPEPARPHTRTQKARATNPKLATPKVTKPPVGKSKG